MNNKERRKTTRLGLPLQGVLTQEQEGQQIEKIVVVKDIDGEGAYFVANIHPIIGKRAKLHLMGVFNQAQISFEVVGTVLRVDDLMDGTCGFAVKFRDGWNPASNESSNGSSNGAASG